MTNTSTFKSVVTAACTGFVIGSLAWSLTVWGQQGSLEPQQDLSIPLNSPQLGPAMNGVLTQAQGRTVWIDGTGYNLAFGMLVQDEHGSPLQDRDIAGKNQNYPVQYWLGVGKTRDQIVRMTVYFPR